MDSSGGFSFDERRELLQLEFEIWENDLKRLKLALKQWRRLGSDGGQRPARSFDISGDLQLVPRFSERDSDIYFSLFEHVADSRHWTDGERTLFLQCTLTGKAQRLILLSQ